MTLMMSFQSPSLFPDSFQSAQAENQRLARLIDHTKLTFAAGEDEVAAIATLCTEAQAAGFYAVCVRPRHIVLAKAYLAGSPVKVATVIGFPAEKVPLAAELKQPTVGAIATAEKLAEARLAIQAGADELDLVLNVSDLKRDMQDGGHRVADELRAVAAVADGRPIKVIIEIDLLTEAEMVQATAWCAETGMAMVKTSTGMVDGGQGATLQAVQLVSDTLRRLNASAVGIKASGGIKTHAQALAFAQAGVSRLGTSSGLAIVQGGDNLAD
jgi:deoxyribose-phosphate aldolase